MNKGSVGGMMVLLLALFLSFSLSAQPDKGNKLRAIIFLGTDCPISQDYVGVINKLKKQFPEVDFVGVLPASDNRKKEKFRDEYQVEFELVTDKKKKLVEKYLVSITPEVVLLDADQMVRYQGAIDNWYFELGRHRPQATEFYLIDAIGDLTAPRDVRVPRTKAIGCILSRRK